MIYLRANIQNKEDGSIRYEYCMLNDSGVSENEKPFAIEKFKIQANEVGTLERMSYEEWEKESNGVGWTL